MKKLAAAHAMGMAMLLAMAHAEADPIPRSTHADATGSLPASVTLAEVLSLVRERNPQLAAEATRVDAARASLVQARLLPNPEVDYEGAFHAYGDNPLDGTEHELLIEQPLLLFGQRKVRTRAAELELALARAELDEAAAPIIFAAREAFVELLAHQERLSVYEALTADLEGVERNIAGRVEAGDRSPYDLMRLRVELAQFRQEFASEAIARDDAAAQLIALMGGTGRAITARGELSAGMPPVSADELWRKAKRNRPDLIVAERRVQAAAGGIERARRERWPVPALGLGALHATDGRGGAVIVTMGVDLPLFDRGQGELAEARAEKLAADLWASATHRQARADIERVTHLLDTRRQALKRFEQDVIEHLPLLRDRAEAAYVAGQIDIVGLLDALSALAEARLSHIDLREQLLATEAEAMAAAGLLDRDLH
jgi:outer membrane protein, heavy metal efflux system